MMDLLGGPSNVDRSMASLTLGEQQLVEIGKALAMPNSSLLCFDEPTAALNQAESRGLLDVIARLKKRGTAAVYVSHRLDELSVIADRILVLRNGRQAGLLAAADADPATIASLMLGRSHSGRNTRSTAAEPVNTETSRFEVQGWRYSGLPSLDVNSLSVAQGEILGVYGLAGSGVESLARGLSGMLPRGQFRGGARVFGQEGHAFESPREARKNGVVVLPANRKRDGLMLSQSIESNFSTARFTAVSQFGFLRKRHERFIAERLTKAYGVRMAGLAQPVGELSGGNQQKVLFANRAESHPRVLVLHEPTRGVDIGARADIHTQIERIRHRNLRDPDLH